MEMPGRVFQSSTAYRYGFNGKEKDDEWKSNGNSYDFGERIFDPRLGRFLSTDPLEKTYPWQSPYAYIHDNPIAKVDFKGMGDGDGGKKDKTDKGASNDLNLVGDMGPKSHTIDDNNIDPMRDHANDWTMRHAPEAMIPDGGKPVPFDKTVNSGGYNVPGQKTESEFEIHGGATLEIDTKGFEDQIEISSGGKLIQQMDMATGDKDYKCNPPSDQIVNKVYTFDFDILYNAGSMKDNKVQIKVINGNVGITDWTYTLHSPNGGQQIGTTTRTSPPSKVK